MTLKYFYGPKDYFDSPVILFFLKETEIQEIITIGNCLALSLSYIHPRVKRKILVRKSLSWKEKIY